MAAFIQMILGGARSGKSRYALHQGNEETFQPKIFLATALPGDAEMKTRIESHQRERGPEWTTREEPYRLLEALQDCAREERGLVVLDCSTLWISNLLCGMGGNKLTPSEIEELMGSFFQALPSMKGSLRIVSNEVGLGLVPENPLGREFRDLQGRFNQTLGALADEVILTVAGLPLKIR
jgi:adenosylcobinamide kinase/adenosylcobinamide-phosphate guanylyltransferase